MNPFSKIFVIALLLSASSHLVGAQSLDNYHLRGTDPDVYNTNRDGTLPRTGGALPKTSAKAKENSQKNRWDMPGASAFDARVTLEAMLAPGNDLHRFTGGRAAKITGIVVGCIVGGNQHRDPPAHSGESCNNGATDSLDTDTHIDVVIKTSDRKKETRHIIVEVTPRVRELMHRRGINWTTDALLARLINHWVEFEGWLFFDPDHVNEAANTDPRDVVGGKNWRASCWEIHPVTGIRVLSGPPAPVRNKKPLHPPAPKR